MKTFFKKNLLLRAAACGFVLTVLLSFTGFSAQCDALEKNVIRLHVLANSDSDADQAVSSRCATPFCSRPGAGTAMPTIRDGARRGLHAPRKSGGRCKRGASRRGCAI